VRARSWSGRTRGGRIGNAFFAALIRSPLYPLASVLLFFVSLYYVFASPKGTRASFDLADRLGLGGSRWRRFRFAWRHNRMFGTLLIDRYSILHGLAHRYEIERPPKSVLEPLKQKRGMLFLSAHLGSWEAMAHLLAHEETAPIHLGMHAGLQAELRGLLEGSRAFRVLVADGSPSSAAAIVQAIRDGEIVAMMGDRRFLDEGVEVELLGARARLPIGPYAIAAAARAPVFLTFAVRTGRRRYRFLTEEFGELSYRNRSDKEADHIRWAQRFAYRLEELLREYPTQWGNFFSLWDEAARVS
jgi:predicted LPLAT superfamily acyltransferase